MFLRTSPHLSTLRVWLPAGTTGVDKDDYLTLRLGGPGEFTFPGHAAAIRVSDASLAAFSVR